MGELEGSYRVIQTPGTRLGAPFNAGISTLEAGQALSANMSAAGKNYGRGLQMRVVGLDESQEFYDMEVSYFLPSPSPHCIVGRRLVNPCVSRSPPGPANTLFRLSVKFFPPDPGQIQEEYTRYLFSLQMKRDLMEARLLCTENTGALLASHLVQSEIGDYDELGDRDYLRLNTLLPYQDKVQDRIMDFHRRHLGQTPAESDFQVLEIARKLEMYGVRFHPASDREGTKINLSVAHMGLQVFQGNTRINTFNWSKIRKLSFKRKRFLIKLHPEVHGPHQDTLEFLMGSRDQCKIFWKNCVEHHSFFRLLDQPLPPTKAILFSRGSSFRYSLRGPGPRASASSPFSYQHSLLSSSSLQRSPQPPLPLLGHPPAAQTPPALEPRLRPPQTHGPAPPSPPRDAPAVAPAPSPRCAVQGAPSLQLSRYPADKAYFIAKEILTTERTYLKDLEVITVWFRSAVIKENAMPEGLMTLLFSNIDPIYEFHRGFLKELDQRLALWEGRSNAHVKGDYQRIGDVMLKNMTALKEFTGYLQKHDEVLTELEKASKRVKKLETVYKEFELQKVCYLPLNTFLLKPIQRLMHFKLILERLSKHYPQDHPDHHDCSEALKEVAQIAAQLQSSLIRLENFQKLTELQRDLVGVENLTSPGREFIREGCLYKLTKKGLQQRMFFLFSDMLLYSSKGVTATNQFKVHGQLPLHGMIVDESESEWSVPHCFTIYSAQRTVVVAARSEPDRLTTQITKSLQRKTEEHLLNVVLGSSDEVSVEQESEDEMSSSHGSLDKQAHHRANTTLHVCWHRNTSVSMSDHSLAVENQLSGYLLRKFKNSNGWQKLWVVFTNFCLFFYKTHQDDFPLASLPLLGYTVSTPEEVDGIHKEYVFKLQFKSHVYFFRAESEYTFERWMEVIRSAAGRMTLLVPRVPAELNRK
uniref:FERM, ARH/RhoGEF and pleckstrin domain protein 2 n=1 Tax=Gadus morhua TaxID=8049 RepID=A0A8C5B549_GADMO